MQPTRHLSFLHTFCYCFLCVTFKQLYLHSHWKLDTCLYELIYSEQSILPPPKIFTIPPETPCTYSFLFRPKYIVPCPLVLLNVTANTAIWFQTLFQRFYSTEAPLTPVQLAILIAKWKFWNKVSVYSLYTFFLVVICNVCQSHRLLSNSHRTKLI